MAIVIEVNGVDKSSLIDWTSVQLDRALTNQVDTLTFNLKRANSSGYSPALLDNILVMENGVTIFGGQVITLGEQYDGYVEYLTVTAKDYSFDMDRNLVVEIYQNMSVHDIIVSIATNVLPAGYTTTNVVCLTTISYIAFNYLYPSKCLQQLAQIANCDWYVDESKNIFFFAQGSKPAPFSVTDTSGTYVYGSLSITQDITNIRNSIIVRGGTYVGNSIVTEMKTADGQQLTFLQAYEYSSVSVKIGSTSQTVGVLNVDDPTLFQCMYDANNRAVIFATAPTANAVVSVGGYPILPVITKLTNSASVAEFGTFQFIITDTNIGSRQAARDRARAEITAWAEDVNDGSFDTRQAGLDTGQVISVQSTVRGISNTYIISRISSRLEKPDRFLHSVTLVTSQTYGIVEFMQRFIVDNAQQLPVNANEVLDFVTDLGDQMTFTDSIGAPTQSAPPYKWGTATWGFATWG